MSIQMLKLLMTKLEVILNALTYKVVMLLGFFGFFRFASLVPPTVKKFHPLDFHWYVISYLPKMGWKSYLNVLRICRHMVLLELFMFQNFMY